MFSARITQAILGWLDRLASRSSAEKTSASHLVIGRRGEEDAYFYLRRRGYLIVARNFRTARHHGEIDLIGWDNDVLCFIEVKTRTTRDVKPAEAAVDRKKRRDIHVMIRYYLRTLPRRHFPLLPPWRLDVITVYYDRSSNPLLSKSESGEALPRGGELHPTFELFQNAALSS